MQAASVHITMMQVSSILCLVAVARDVAVVTQPRCLRTCSTMHLAEHLRTHVTKQYCIACEVANCL